MLAEMYILHQSEELTLKDVDKKCTNKKHKISV